VSEFATSTDPIHNSQCAVFGGPTTVSDDGATLTFTVTLTFMPTFNGRKLLYVRAVDNSNQDTGYEQVGVWTVSGTSRAPDFSVAVSPGSRNVSGDGFGQYFVRTIALNGYTGTIRLSVSGFPLNWGLSISEPSVMAGDYSSFAVQTLDPAPPRRLHSDTDRQRWHPYPYSDCRP
jgi:hypothetical protein